jgi:hypothetical protein
MSTLGVPLYDWDILFASGELCGRSCREGVLEPGRGRASAFFMRGGEGVAEKERVSLLVGGLSWESAKLSAPNWFMHLRSDQIRIVACSSASSMSCHPCGRCLSLTPETAWGGDHHTAPSRPSSPAEQLQARELRNTFRLCQTIDTTSPLPRLSLSISGRHKSSFSKVSIITASKWADSTSACTTAMRHYTPRVSHYQRPPARERPS